MPSQSSIALNAPVFAARSVQRVEHDVRPELAHRVDEALVEVERTRFVAQRARARERRLDPLAIETSRSELGPPMTTATRALLISEDSDEVHF